MADAPKANALSPGDIVVMDNLGGHNGRAAIRAAKAKLLFLPRLLARPQSDRTGLRQNEDLPRWLPELNSARTIDPNGSQCKNLNPTPILTKTSLCV